MFQAVLVVAVAVAVGDVEVQLSNQGVAEPQTVTVQTQYPPKMRNQIAFMNYLRMPRNIGELSMEPQGKKSGPHLLARTTMQALWFLA